MENCTHPVPPDDLDGEALLEWQRVTAELAQCNLLDQSDRAVMTLYCRTWATWREADKLVAKYGSVIKYTNGVPGPAPFFKTAMESAKHLRALLADMGMTPSSRHKMSVKKIADSEPAPLEY
jgi:P27 family predicted phage terminase small subunit